MTTLGFAFLASVLVFLTYVYQKRMHRNAIDMLDLKRESQKALFAAVSNTEQIERERIATNLHDEVGMALNMVKQNLSRQKRHISPEDAHYQLTLDSITLLNKTIAKISTSVYDLVPKFLLEFGLMSSLQNDLDIINRAGDVKTSLFVLANFEFETHFDKRIILEINRICTELLNNILKHSKCTNLSLEIMCDLKFVTLTYKHNGQVLTNEDVDRLTEKSSGLGLRSIKGRCLIINANIKYYSENSLAVTKFVIPL